MTTTTTAHVHQTESITGVTMRELDESAHHQHKATTVRAVGGVHSVHVDHVEYTDRGTDSLVVSVFGADRLTLDPQVLGRSISLRGIDCDIDLFFHDPAAMVGVLRLAADVLENSPLLLKDSPLLTNPDA